MIKLVIAIGFLSVFGIVTYCLVLLLTKYFKTPDSKSNEKETNKKQKNGK